MVVFGGPPPGPDGPFIEDASIELSLDAPSQTWQYANLAFFPQGPNRDVCPIGTTYAQITPDNAMLKSCILDPMVGHTKQILVMGQQPRPGGLGPDGIPTGISPEARQQILEQRRRDGEGRGDGKEEGKGLGKGQGQASNDIVAALIYPIKTTAGVAPAQAVANLGASLQAIRFPTPQWTASGPLTATGPLIASGPSGATALQGILPTPPPVAPQRPPGLGLFRGGATTKKTTKKSSIVTVPSALSQLATSLANIDANTASMNENMAALLEAFNAANPAQQGGRRRQTKVKRKGKGRRTTRR